MTPPSPRNKWSEFRRGLVILVLLIGAMSVFSLVQGRPGDLEAGAIGGVIGGLIAAVVIAVELIGRRLARKLTRTDGEQPLHDPGVMSGPNKCTTTHPDDIYEGVIGVNAIERQVMDFALRGNHPLLAVLREQLDVASVSSRKFTGVGFFTDFAVPNSAPRLESLSRIVIGDVYGEVASLQHGAGFLVFIDGGTLNMLECYIFEDAWPAGATIRRLYYMHPQGPKSASLVEVEKRDLDFALDGLA